MAEQLVTKREGLTGGVTGVSGDVDGISATNRGDGNALQDGDLCDVVVSGNVFNYKYSSGTADVENSPYLIKPDTGAASGYAWILQNKIAGLDTSTTVADADKIEVLKDSTGLSVNMARSDFMEHNIAYHDDTTATGDELNTLTNGSMGDALHDHSGLSASDGTPGDVVSVDEGGKTSFSGDVIVPGTSIVEFGDYTSSNEGTIIEMNGVRTSSKTAATTLTYHNQYQNGNGTIGWVSTTGSTTTFSTVSDYRLKNIDRDTDGYEASIRVKKLKPKRGSFKADKKNIVSDMFIAHEVAEVVPEAVTGEKDATDKKGNMILQGLDNSKLIPLLTAALINALERIEVLEKRV